MFILVIATYVILFLSSKNSGSQYGVRLIYDETEIFVSCVQNTTLTIKVENNGDDNDWEKCETKFDKILLVMKAGWYINPENW